MNIDDSLLVAAKERATRTGRPLGAVIDDALRVLLTDRAPRAGRFVLPTDGGSGLQPGVDLEDKEALADLLDRADNQTPRRRAAR